MVSSPQAVADVLAHGFLAAGGAAGITARFADITDGQVALASRLLWSFFRNRRNVVEAGWTCGSPDGVVWMKMTITATAIFL